MRNRILSLNRIRRRNSFDSLAASFKRIKNILQKSVGSREGADREVHFEIFKQDEEAALYSSVLNLKDKLLGSGTRRDYDLILESIAEMRPVVDQFFDKVLVNTDDEAIRRNRFNLLLALYDEFMRIADFSELQPAAAFS